MRTVKPIKNQIKKLERKLAGKPLGKVLEGTPSGLQTDTLGNKYRVVDGRRELVNEDALKAEIKRQEAAIEKVQSRVKKSKAAAPVLPTKKGKKVK